MITLSVTGWQLSAGLFRVGLDTLLDKSHTYVILEMRGRSGAWEMGKDESFVLRVINIGPMSGSFFIDISNGANFQKLVDRMRWMCDLFDRPCVIIEKDRLKPGETDKHL